MNHMLPSSNINSYAPGGYAILQSSNYRQYVSSTRQWVGTKSKIQSHKDTNLCVYSKKESLCWVFQRTRRKQADNWDFFIKNTQSFWKDWVSLIERDGISQLRNTFNFLRSKFGPTWNFISVLGHPNTNFFRLTTYNVGLFGWRRESLSDSTIFPRGEMSHQSFSIVFIRECSEEPFTWKIAIPAIN